MDGIGPTASAWKAEVLPLYDTRIKKYQSFHLKEQDFQRIYNSRLNDKESDPYKVLGANRDDSDDDIRNKWILLTKEHHPDNLIAKGMPQEFVDQANKELSAINLAYDNIKKYRGIN